MVSLPQLHPGQLALRQRIADRGARFVTTMCGRQFGKSTDGEEWIADGAISGFPVAWIAPTYKYLDPVWRDLVVRLRPITKRVDSQQHRLELLGGGAIECWTFDNPDPGRGRKYKRVVCDEAGLVPDIKDIFEASIRPTLLFYEGDCRFYGTPKGRTHQFVLLFAKGESGEDGWASFRAKTADNPYIPPGEIEKARQQLPPAIFAQEFEGIPADDQANPFGAEAVRVCIAPLSEEPPIAWGWDFARAQDWTVGIGLDKNGHVARLERWQRVPWAESRARVRNATGHVYAQGDSTGIGDVIVEDLQRDGMEIMGYQFTPKSKQALMERLAAAIQQRTVTFPDGVIRTELDTFEYEYGAHGVRYTAPDGLHDDCVMALALAVYCYDRVAPYLPKPQPPKWQAADNQDSTPWEEAHAPVLNSTAGSMGQLPGDNW